jgi:hypothetical protein
VSALDAHAQVFLTLLDADNTPPALAVLDSVVPDLQAPPYVLLYFSWRTPTGVDEPDKVALESTSDVIDVEATCHSVGVTPGSARAIAGRVRAHLLGVVPTITNRVCFPIIHRDGTTTQRDETTGVTVFDQIDIYGFTSLPG